MVEPPSAASDYNYLVRPAPEGRLEGQFQVGGVFIGRVGFHDGSVGEGGVERFFGDGVEVAHQDIDGPSGGGGEFGARVRRQHQVGGGQAGRPVRGDRIASGEYMGGRHGGGQ